MIVEQFGFDFELGFANVCDQNNDTISENPIYEKINVTFIEGFVYKL